MRTAYPQLFKDADRMKTARLKTRAGSEFVKTEMERFLKRYGVYNDTPQNASEIGMH